MLRGVLPIARLPVEAEECVGRPKHRGDHRAYGCARLARQPLSGVTTDGRRVGRAAGILEDPPCVVTSRVWEKRGLAGCRTTSPAQERKR